MRLMGATEGAIRAPFWLYASLEGLAGGIARSALLYATYRLATAWLSREPHPVLASSGAGSSTFRPRSCCPLVGVAAGFLGSLLSLGRKRGRRRTRKTRGPADASIRDLFPIGL